MTENNMQEYEGLRQFVGVCCTRDPAERPGALQLLVGMCRPGLMSGQVWLRSCDGVQQPTVQQLQDVLALLGQSMLQQLPQHCG
jgi:hypothetical protein